MQMWNMDIGAVAFLYVHDWLRFQSGSLNQPIAVCTALKYFDSAIVSSPRGSPCSTPVKPPHKPLDQPLYKNRSPFRAKPHACPTAIRRQYVLV